MSKRNLFLLFVVGAALLVATGVPTKSNPDPVQLIAGRNVNMVSGTEWPEGDPWLQRQNEPSIAVSTRNPLHLLAGANDYRSIDVQFEDELPGYEKESSARDAWLGVFKSYDGGQSWTSTLLPGYLYADTTPDGCPISPLLGYEAAADPVVRAGTNGLFYYCGITFNRGQRGLGQVFVARFIDNNNRETGAIEYIDTKIIDVGNSGHFIDKPWIAVDIPRDGSPKTTLPNGQEVPCGNVYIVYTSFMGDLAEDAHSKMMFSMSTDCGETWSKPTQITDAGQPYQAAALAINPIDGRPYVAYRRFAKDHTDAIMLCWAERKGKETADGYWHGNIKFSKPIILAEIDPFDQPTSEVTFRTNDYPTMTIDKDGIIYVAWSQRGMGPYGEGKIVMKTSADGGQTWLGPALVDDPNHSGYQFMPSLTSGAGKVMMLWYDQRWDYCEDGFADLYIQESYPIRHTIDVRAAEVHAIPNPYFSYEESIQVSRYPYIFTPDFTWAIQLQTNKPNLRIFGGGKVPFFGDYIDISPSPMFVPQGDGWAYNTDPDSTRPVYHAVWTDNRDVRPPGPEGGPEGDWTNYVAPGEGCIPQYENQTGIRNQNIYTSRITEGIIAGSPGNTKPLNIDRAFVVFVKNATGTPLDLPRNLILKIVETSGATAYFMKAGENVGTKLEVEVPPQSSVAATVMVESYSNQYATVRIDVYEGVDLLTYILLNPDSTNPFIEDPEGLDPESPHVGSEGETHTPHVGSEDVINWEYSVDSPHVGSEDATSPHVGSNDDWVTPHVGSDDDIVTGSTIHVGSNNHIIMSNIVNPHVGSDDFDAIPEGTSMTDIVWTVENTGNTTSTFSLSTFPFYDYNPDQIAVQLIVYKVYTTPTALGCELKEQEHHELIVSQTSPHVGSDEFPSMSVPWSFSDVTFSIPPKGTGEGEVEYKVILRYMDKDTTDEFELDPEDQGIFVESEAPDIIDGAVISPASALVIKTRTIDLDNGIAGTTYYETLEVMGGYENNEYTWSLDGPASTWLNIVGTPISNICNVIGTPPSTGTYQLIVNVENTDLQYNRPTLSETKTLSIRVVNALQITKTTLYDAFKGGGYVDTLEAYGGTEPYVWSIVGGSLPDGLALTPGTNRIEGTISPTAGDSTFTVQVSDFGNPTLTDSLQMTIDVYDPPQITTSSPLPDGNTGTAYSVTLSGSGGNTPYAWSVFSGTLPLELSLNSFTGEISGTPTVMGTSSFTIRLTDSSNPQQIFHKDFTITIIEPFITIDFDTDPSGGTISAGTIINDVYAPLGVTFEKLGPGTNCGSGPEVYANSNSPTPPLSGNVVSTCPEGIASDISENNFGRIEARFSKPVKEVCIDVVPPYTGYAFLEAFDANDVVLGRVTSAPGVNETLCISQTGIRGVRFSGEGNNFARFDNMKVLFSLPMVYILENSDPDWTNPPFEDKLTIINPLTHTKVQTLSGFNFAQTVGGQRRIASSDNGQAVVICDKVAQHLLKYDVSGNLVFDLSRNIHSIDVAENSDIYALTTINTIYGDKILLLNSEGAVLDEASFGGFDVAVDDNSNSVWIVGADIKRLNKELVEQFTVDPIGWVAVSVDFNSSGDAWVAEREHSQIQGSQNRLLKISKDNGSILETIDLSFSPFCLSVDRSDNSFWVASSNGLLKYDQNGNELMQIETNDRWSVKVSQNDGSVWVAGYGNVNHYARDGVLISEIPGFSNDQAYVAFKDHAVSPGVKTKLLWVNEPSSPIAQGATWDSFSIEITDEFGNRITDATDAVTIFPASLGGTRTQNAVAGVATFNDIYSDTPGSISVYAEASGLNFTPPDNVEVITVLNSVPNSSFEQDVDQNGFPDGWQPVGNNVTFLYPNDHGCCDSNRSAGMSCVGTCNEIAGWTTTHYIYVQPNTEYADSVWYWVNNENASYPEDYSGDIGMYVTYYDKHGNELGGGGGGHGHVPPSTDWVQISGQSGASPAEFRMVKITLQWNTENASNHNPTSPVEVYFDSVVWEPIVLPADH